jgi:hypothetical protein
VYIEDGDNVVSWVGEDVILTCVPYGMLPYGAIITKAEVRCVVYCVTVVCV